jgi:single-strand DNA-binding protein
MSARLNKVQFIGRLGADPRLAYLPSGQPVVNFSLATDESYTDKNGNKVDKAEWHRIVAFGKIAEFVQNYLGKGRQVFIEGKLRTRKWQDQQGQDRYTTEVVAYNIQALDKKPEQTPAEASMDMQTPPPSEMPEELEDAPF